MIEENPHVVHGAKEKKGTWQQIFGNDHPIRIEVGMGKGQFILEQASRNPDVNFVGIEKYSTVLLKAIRKREQMELSNIYFLCEDARELAEIFGPGEVERIYLNFSDPWPKDRHARRRLTSPPFMAVYDQILQKDGRVEFKTDNQDLFSYSLEAIPEAGWHITEYTRDLHHSEMAEGNVMTEYEEKFSVKYDVSFSIQKPSTDTVAAAMDNTPFRDKNDKLLFRPGGHGALIENLNDLDADIIFIKNIDNVVPDKLKGDTVLYKKLIAGVLITLQQQAFAYLQLLDSGKYTHEQVLDILQFVQKKLFCKNPETKNLEDAELVIYLKNKLNRPMRVCGMVKNVGEPGGGPFLAYNSDGTISLQILESSQIDMNDPEKKDMFEKGTHFNPVDLVCAVRDYKGHKFDLVKYVDKATGFISYKSKNGKDLKALELPGLWNGAMSDWNTVFVEVPLTTFNPVKTVNDLLREQHQ